GRCVTSRRRGKLGDERPLETAEKLGLPVGKVAATPKRHELAKDVHGPVDSGGPGSQIVRIPRRPWLVAERPDRRVDARQRAFCCGDIDERSSAPGGDLLDTQHEIVLLACAEHDDQVSPALKPRWHRPYP